MRCMQQVLEGDGRLENESRDIENGLIGQQRDERRQDNSDRETTCASELERFTLLADP